MGFNNCSYNVFGSYIDSTYFRAFHAFKKMTMKILFMGCANLSLIFSILFLFESSAAPLLEVNLEDRKVILIASTHLGVQAIQQDPILENIIKKSKVVCFENDPVDVELPKNMQLALFLNRHDEKLENIIGKELYEKAKNYIDPNSLNSKSLNIFSPYAVAGFINLTEPSWRKFQGSLRPEYSIDSYVLSLALSNGKKISGIEDSNALIQSFRSISDDEWKVYVAGSLYLRACEKCETNFLKHYVESYLPNDDYRYVYETLKLAYEEKPDMFSIYDKFFFSRRNQEIVENIVQKNFKQDSCDVIAIGAGHFGGINGIVNRLHKKGFATNSLNGVP